MMRAPVHIAVGCGLRGGPSSSPRFSPLCTFGSQYQSGEKRTQGLPCRRQLNKSFSPSFPSLLRARHVDHSQALSSGGDDDSGGGFGGRSGDGGAGDDSQGRFEGESPIAPASAFAALWARYVDTLESHPLLIKSLTAACLNGLADLICQVGIERVDTLDVKRLLSFLAIGLFMSGPGLHYWYGVLANVITVPGIGGLVMRIAADQLIFTPLGIGSFFVVLLFLEGRQGDIVDKLQKDWLETVVANWKVWIPFQVVNFGFVPPQLQVAAAGVLGMVWSIFISFKGHS